MITSSSYDKFRIVIENYGGPRGEFPHEFNHIEEIIDYLREVGCKVPVLIYTDSEYTPEMNKQFMRLKKKYLMLFNTHDVKDLRKFC